MNKPNEDVATTDWDIETSKLEPSGWECNLFGSGPNGIVWRPTKGNVPNRFWRLMQFLILGNHWRKVPRG